MSRWRIDRSPVLQLYWSETGLWSFDKPGEAGQAWPDFEAWCAAHPGRRLRLWLGGASVHSLVIPADMPLPDTAAMNRYARLQLAHYFGPAAQAWPLASWQLGAQRGVCALQETPGGLSLAAVRESVRAHGLRLLSLRPLWCLALEAAARADARWAAARHCGLALLEGRLLSWLNVGDGALLDIQQRYLDRCDGSELQALLDELQPVGLSYPPRLMGWGLGDSSQMDDCWPAALQGGPQDAAWLGGLA